MATEKKEQPHEEEELGLDTDMSEGTITLQAKGGETFEVERAFALISNLIQTSLESDPDAEQVPIPGVDGPILTMVVEYMNHHKGKEPELIPKPLRSKIMKEVCKDEWDAIYIDSIGENVGVLYKLVLAANYLDIQGLLHLGAAKVAAIAKGENTDRITELLTPNEDKAD